MRRLLFLCLVLGHLHAQDVARPSHLVPLSPAGEFVISTRKAPGSAPNAQPEVYEVITGKDSGATLTLGALGTVKMDKETQIRMPAAGAPQSLEMLKGKLFFEINAAELKKNQNAEFRLKTPAALLAVKGTQFFVEANGGQETIGVYEGAAAIATLALRSTALLQKGQASTHGQGQAVRPRPMRDEELALGATYAATLPLKTSVLALAASGTSGMAEYVLKGEPATVSRNDAEAISKLGATVMILQEPPGEANVKLNPSGVVAVSSRRARGVAALRFKLIFQQPANLKAAALRFYLRASSDYTVSVDGRPLATAPRRAGQNQSAPWCDCLLDLQTPAGAQHSFTLELISSATKTNAKANAPILELSDFTCLSPVAP